MQIQEITYWQEVYMSNLQVILPETEAFDTRCIIAFMSETAESPRPRDSVLRCVCADKYLLFSQSTIVVVSETV